MYVCVLFVEAVQQNWTPLVSDSGNGIIEDMATFLKMNLISWFFPRFFLGGPLRMTTRSRV
jgi:hypothetical protein